MKNFKKLALIAFTAIMIGSCSNDDTTPVLNNSIAGSVSRTSDLSNLLAALTRADLVSVLDGDASGPFTVFAPSNAAFATFLSANGFASLDEVPVPVLKEVLLNHVVSGTVLSSQLSTGYVKTLGKGAASSTNTLSLYIDLTNGVKLNGTSSVTTADNICTNGVIHYVDKVIPMPTIVTHATSNSNFTSLVGALTSPGQPDFVSILSGTTSSPFTVFAPTNDAFTSLNTELAPGGIASVSAANLTKVLQYHVVGGANVLSTSLTNNMMVATLLGQNFTVGLTGGAKITDFNNRVSNIVAVDVQCTNGVIHVLDKVLLPNLN